MAHKKADVKTHKGSMPKSLSHVQTVSTTLEDNQSIIKEHFDRSPVCALVHGRVCMYVSVRASLSLARSLSLCLSLLSLLPPSLSPSLPPPLPLCAQMPCPCSVQKVLIGYQHLNVTIPFKCHCQHLNVSLLRLSGVGRMSRFLVQVAQAARENKTKEEDSLLNQ